MLTIEQREARKKYCGSSDAAAVLGLSPYKSAADIWLSKTGQCDDAADNDATDAGTRLEGVVLDWAEEQVGEFLRDEMSVHANGLLAANFDGIGYQTDCIQRFVVEAKSTGIVGPADPAYGDVTEGPDVELPDHVIVQIHHQMVVAGDLCRLAWVPVLIGRVGFRMYRVDRSDELAAVVEDRCSEFMDKYVRLGIRPDDFKPSLEVLRRMRREPQKRVEIPRPLFFAWTAARAARLEAEKREKEATTALLAELDDAEAGTCDGVDVCTYFERERKEYVVKASKHRTLLLAKGAKLL